MHHTKINPPIETIRQQEPNHAVFESLFGPNLIERFDVYRIDNSNLDVHSSASDKTKHHPTIPSTCTTKYKKRSQHLKPIQTTKLKLGKKLNGHPQIIHGGIIALLFDEFMGWARVIVTPDNDGGSSSIYVTANLNVDYRSPLREDCEILLTIYHVVDENENGDDGDAVRKESGKVKLFGVLTNQEGVVCAEATGLFVRVRSKL